MKTVTIKTTQNEKKGLRKQKELRCGPCAPPSCRGVPGYGWRNVVIVIVVIVVVAVVAVVIVAVVDAV